MIVQVFDFNKPKSASLGPKYRWSPHRPATHCSNSFFSAPLHCTWRCCRSVGAGGCLVCSCLWAATDGRHPCILVVMCQLAHPNFHLRFDQNRPSHPPQKNPQKISMPCSHFVACICQTTTLALASWWMPCAPHPLPWSPIICPSKADNHAPQTFVDLWSCSFWLDTWDNIGSMRLAAPWP